MWLQKNQTTRKKKKFMYKKKSQISDHLPCILIIALSCDLDKLCMLGGKE